MAKEAVTIKKYTVQERVGLKTEAAAFLNLEGK